MKKINLLQLILLITLISSCGKRVNDRPTEVIASNNIFGEVNKIKITSSFKERQVIGLLYSHDLKSSCTATLIHYDLIITAAHCLYMIEGKIAPLNYTFVLRDHNARTIDSSKISEATRSSDEETHNDWAILKLSKPLGKKYGFMTPKLISKKLIHNDSYNNTLSGYGAAFEKGEILTTHSGCNIRKHLSNDIFLHDCDSSKGDSGGPIYKCHTDSKDNKYRCYILGTTVAQRISDFKDGKNQIALHSEYYNEEYANIGITVKSWKATYLKLINKKKEVAPVKVDSFFSSLNDIFN